jgi:hypothetical protein
MTMTPADCEKTGKMSSTSLRAWKGSRCPSTLTARSTLTSYGFNKVARFHRNENRFQVFDRDLTATAWCNCVYAFVINDEIVRIGSSKDRLGARFNAYQNDLSYAFAGDFYRSSGKPRSTKVDEATIWSIELATHGHGDIWAREGTQFFSPITQGTISGYQDEESFLIAKHQPRLNRGSHR